MLLVVTDSMVTEIRPETTTVVQKKQVVGTRVIEGSLHQLTYEDYTEFFAFLEAEDAASTTNITVSNNGHRITAEWVVSRTTHVPRLD